MKKTENLLTTQNAKYPISIKKLHKYLGVKKDYSAWVSQKKTNLNLVVCDDFLPQTEGRKVDHLLTYDAAFKIIKSVRETALSMKVEQFLSKQIKIEEKDSEIQLALDNNYLDNSPFEFFHNDEFGGVRMIKVDNKAYAVGVDIARVLGYSKPNNAVNAHCRCTLKQGIPHPQSKDKTIEVVLIQQSDIIRLVMSSKLSQAERFESWVIDEVIPSVLKHGFYGTTEAVDAFLSNPDAAMKLLAEYKKEREEKEKLLVEAKTNEPKIMAYDDFINSNDAYSISEAAKILNIPVSPYAKKLVGKNTLLSWLRRDKILISNMPDRNTPYQSYCDRGWFELVTDDNNSTGRKLSLLVTPKGIEGMYRKYKHASMPKKINIPTKEEITDLAI